MDTKQRITKRRNHKTATITKQRLLQNENSDYYRSKTATTTKQQLLQNGEISRCFVMRCFVSFPGRDTGVQVSVGVGGGGRDNAP